MLLDFKGNRTLIHPKCRVNCTFEMLNFCLILLLQLPPKLLEKILLDVVLDTGDTAYMTLSLVCQTFLNVVSQDSFRKEAHLLWILSKNNIGFISETYK